ncbi:MAG: penicillin-binding protein [Desulfuromonadaceae bacterium GWB2_53_15]|nr:MAG: penicillin-binding protein [Desulfuromonadales bacterium GWD2_54_10]OHB25653.1 MAG: penicillin-binding protein [Desulfuromonadaceae bacterium GWB2_53_15]
MQDLKHLTRKKRFSGFGFSSSSNRRLMTVRGNDSRRFSLPTGKRREQLKHLLLFLAIVLGLTPVCLVVFQKAPHAAKAMAEVLRSQLNSPPALVEAAKLPPASSFQAACQLLDSATATGEDLTAQTAAGETILYTIRGDLQKRVHDFMAANQVPYGVFVAIEPSSGRVLAMTAHSSVDPQWAQGAFFDLYPMASLFKIVTASAALENNKITPETVIEFRGNSYSENPRYWEASPRGKNNRMDVTYAMGKSINPVYGRVAADIAGKASVLESIHKFGFNQALLPGTPAKQSKAAEPQSTHELMLMGAGLDHEVKISPLHAALIMAAIANGGRMMSPGLTEKVTDARGSDKTIHATREIRQLVSPETASSLTRMLCSTVTSGTSRKAFHDRQGRPRLDVEIAAKTGSINGTDPRGHYSWFAAFAPARNPRIALVALVINQDKWKIKSSQVGEQALQEFFGK